MTALFVNAGAVCSFYIGCVPQSRDQCTIGRSGVCLHGTRHACSTKHRPSASAIRSHVWSSYGWVLAVSLAPPKSQNFILKLLCYMSIRGESSICSGSMPSAGTRILRCQAGSLSKGVQSFGDEAHIYTHASTFAKMALECILLGHGPSPANSLP